MRFVLRHPDDPTVRARYGHDPERGVWAELEYCGVVVVYDAAEPDFDVERPVLGVLRFLASYGFLVPDDVDAAFEWVAGAGEPHGWPAPRRRAPRRGCCARCG